MKTIGLNDVKKELSGALYDTAQGTFPPLVEPKIKKPRTFYENLEFIEKAIKEARGKELTEEEIAEVFYNRFNRRMVRSINDDELAAVKDGMIVQVAAGPHFPAKYTFKKSR